IPEWIYAEGRWVKAKTMASKTSAIPSVLIPANAVMARSPDGSVTALPQITLPAPNAHQHPSPLQTTPHSPSQSSVPPCSLLIHKSTSTILPQSVKPESTSSDQV